MLELGSVSCLSRVSVTIGRQAGSTDALLVTSTVSSAVQGRTRLVACLREHVEHDATRDVSMTYRHDVTRANSVVSGSIPRNVSFNYDNTAVPTKTLDRRSKRRRRCQLDFGCVVVIKRQV